LLDRVFQAHWNTLFIANDLALGMMRNPLPFAKDSSYINKNLQIERKMLQRKVIVELSSMGKKFGIVEALKDINLQINSGECTGLVGHNGAGKSTLINVLSGVIEPSSGSVRLVSDKQSADYCVAVAHRHGIRCVFQELSLCPNLSVAENTRVMHGAMRGWGWRKRASALIVSMLNEIFPGHGIKGSDFIEDLTISQRQMVEIARAFSTTNIDLKLVILDEPTSSLDAIIAAQLMTYIRKFVTEGGACILISHMLEEVLASCDRIVVMRDGTIVATDSAQQFNRDSLVHAMGSVAREYQNNTDSGKTKRSGKMLIECAPIKQQDQRQLQAFAGEIIGLAGLAGQGQTKMLLQLFAPKQSMSFVAGDRQNDGVFPLWSIAENIAIGSIQSMQRFFMTDTQASCKLAGNWQQKIAIRTPSVQDNILSLSGGNQQKVLFARALASPAQVILMDDPMRGVDIGTKQDVYDMLREQAQSGRTFIWYTTEFDELKHCDHVYVFRDDQIVLDLPSHQLTEQQVIQASFQESIA